MPVLEKGTLMVSTESSRALTSTRGGVMQAQMRQAIDDVVTPQITATNAKIDELREEMKEGLTGVRKDVGIFQSEVLKRFDKLLGIMMRDNLNQKS